MIFTVPGTTPPPLSSSLFSSSLLLLSLLLPKTQSASPRIWNMHAGLKLDVLKCPRRVLPLSRFRRISRCSSPAQLWTERPSFCCSLAYSTHVESDLEAIISHTKSLAHSTREVCLLVCDCGLTSHAAAMHINHKFIHSNANCCLAYPLTQKGI